MRTRTITLDGIIALRDLPPLKSYQTRVVDIHHKPAKGQNEAVTEATIEEQELLLQVWGTVPNYQTSMIVDKAVIIDEFGNFTLKIVDSFNSPIFRSDFQYSDAQDSRTSHYFGIWQYFPKDTEFRLTEIRIIGIV